MQNKFDAIQNRQRVCEKKNYELLCMKFSKFWQDNQKSCYCCGSEHLIYLLAFKCLAVCITDVIKMAYHE